LADHQGGDELMRFLPLGVAGNPAVIEERPLFAHHGTASERAFGRLMHSVLHQALLDRQTDTLVQRLLSQIGHLPAGALRNDLERQLVERELRRASRLLAAGFATEAHNFGSEAPAWRARAGDYLGRYVTSGDYLFAKVLHYPMPGPQAEPRLLPMLEFAFRVPTKLGVDLVGRFDRVDDGDDGPVVVDYKTGPPRSLLALRHDHQMLLYAAAIADLTGARSVTCEIHWLAAGTKSTLVFAGAELGRARADAARYAHQIERSVATGTERPWTTTSGTPGGAADGLTGAA